MEQVFEMSNKFLSRDRKTKFRNLRFRTYIVIALAQKTGVLEFVGDSQGIGDWLRPAHHRYGQVLGDIRSDKFRSTLKPMQEKEEKSGELVSKYTALMESFHPVMRHFFTEKHRDPMAWFAMRLNYIRSVAVTSMVGWVLGIGDRHCSNILIDQITGELVHIDFGIVFEEVSDYLSVFSLRLAAVRGGEQGKRGGRWPECRSERQRDDEEDILFILSCSICLTPFASTLRLRKNPQNLPFSISPANSVPLVSPYIQLLG